MPGVELKGGNSPREFYFILFYFYVMNDEFAHIMYLMSGLRGINVLSFLNKAFLGKWY